MMKSYRTSGNVVTHQRLHNKILWALVYILLPISLAFNVDFVSPVVDSFHEGEYLGNIFAIENYYSTSQNFPVFIHGAMDFIPSVLSSHLHGGAHIIVWTRFFNILAVAICWFVWLDLSRIILQRHESKFAWHSVYIFLFIWMASATGDDPVLKQQAFLGTRDLFLILSIWCAIRAVLSTRLTISNSLLILSGSFAAITFYWSYDRGVMAAVWVASLLISFVFFRKNKSAILLLLGYVATLYLVSTIGLLGSITENFENIIYWISSAGEVWVMPLKMKLLPLPGAIAMAVFSALVIAHSIRKIVQKNTGNTTPAVIGLILIQLIFLRKLYSLPGFPTTYYFIWPSILLLVLAPPKLRVISIVNSSLVGLFKELAGAWDVIKKQERLFIAGGSALVIIFVSNLLVSDFLHAKQLVINAPSDEKLIDHSHYGGVELEAHDISCVFQWSNEGIFTLLLKKPFCTRYGYAVYIATENETEVLAELRLNPPGLIIYDSPHPWSMNIYGRAMRDRLPNIDGFIRENYLFQRNEAGYVFATPKILRSVKQ